MGLTILSLEIANPTEPTRHESLDFLVDTGAFHAIAPTPLLRQLGIPVMGEQQFRLADGRSIRRKIGTAQFRYQDRVGGATVIFGEDGDSQLLGASTLESMGLGLDPLRRELHPLPLVI